MPDVASGSWLDIAYDFLPDGRLLIQRDGGTTCSIEAFYDDGTLAARRRIRARPDDDRFNYRLPMDLMRPTPGVLLRSDGARTNLVSGRPLPPLDQWNQFGPSGMMSFGCDALIASQVQWFGRGLSNIPEGIVWDALTGRHLCMMETGVVGWRSLAISPDARWFALNGGRGIELRELSESMEPRRPRALHYIPAKDVKTFAFSPRSDRLATAESDGTVLVWRVPQPRATASVVGSADQVWHDLASNDPTPAWKALWRLLDHADQAIEILRARLRPVAQLKDSAAQIARLDHPRYAVREAAMIELARRGETIEADLRSALHAPASEEQRSRLEALLKRLDATAAPTGDALRSLRCIWLLERIATPAAKELLGTLAKGSSGSRVTSEAKKVLGRWVK